MSAVASGDFKPEPLICWKGNAHSDINRHFYKRDLVEVLKKITSKELLLCTKVKNLIKKLGVRNVALHKKCSIGMEHC